MNSMIAQGHIELAAFYAFLTYEPVNIIYRGKLNVTLLK